MVKCLNIGKPIYRSISNLVCQQKIEITDLKRGLHRMLGDRKHRINAAQRRDQIEARTNAASAVWDLTSIGLMIHHD